MEEQDKPFTTLGEPLIQEHIRKVLKLEAELSTKEEFNPAMILEYHLQLAAISIVAATNYNVGVTALMFTSACEQLKEMCHEELSHQPANFVSGNETVQ